MSPPVQGIYSNENEKIKRKLDISKNKFWFKMLSFEKF
jgi:hypothetical protein